MFNSDNLKLDINKLKSYCNLDNLNFNTTEDIEAKKDIIGQDRAVKAIEFGLKMKQKGYNIYVAGASGTGRNSYTHTLIDRLKKDGVKKINFLCVIAAPEGVESLKKAHKDVKIYCACVDRCLNENGYILPGLGDAGDRVYGTK